MVGSSLPAALVTAQMAPLRERVAQLEAAEEKHLVLHKSMLWCAARSGDASTVLALLQHASVPVDFVARSSGATVSFAVVDRTSVDRVIAAGEQIGYTPQYVAARHGRAVQGCPQVEPDLPVLGFRV